MRGTFLAPLILGAGGQVGRALLAEFARRGVRAAGLDYPRIDLSRPLEAAERVLQLRPSMVINAAAYTAADQAESEPELAYAVNAESPGRLAKACAELAIPFVHYSTDYVFSGQGERPWTEEDPALPLNVYGQTKLAGDRAVELSGAKHLILRTSWVYSQDRKNFVSTMLKLGAEREELKVVDDQFGAPTYAPHLAIATIEAIETEGEGLFHLCSSGVTTRHAFAQAIFEYARARGLPLRVRRVLGVPSVEFPTPATRPSNSRLSTAKIFDELGVRMPHWNQGLLEYFGPCLGFVTSSPRSPSLSL